MEEDNLREELLEAAEPSDDSPQEPKRNSKQSLIDKIIELSQQEGIPLECSNTKLKRMNKKELSSLLADMIEQGIRKKMARQVGCDQNADNRTIALGALRMLHDVCAMGAEKAGNAFLDGKGYEIAGFTDALREPTVSSCIDGCLAEIADENQDLLEYVQSPYTRLAIAWGGALAFSCKQKQNNAPVMESRSARTQNPIRRGRDRGAPPRKVHFDLPPLVPHAKTV